MYYNDNQDVRNLTIISKMSDIHALIQDVGRPCITIKSKAAGMQTGVKQTCMPEVVTQIYVHMYIHTAARFRINNIMRVLLTSETQS